MRKRVAVVFAVVLIVGLVAGRTQLQDLLLPVPAVPGEWNTLLREVRAFERRIGFHETANFKAVYEEKGSYTMCGFTSPFALPYSYEDPAIRWTSAPTESDCRAQANGGDVYFTHIEAVGESGVALTSTMLEGKLDRFLYLVIHEDCHDQFDLPYGIEEALCNVIGYEAMAAFAGEKYGVKAREERAVQRYVDTQAALTRAVVGYYQQVEQLYARYARSEIVAHALLVERARIFGGAERTMGWNRQTLNNVGLANEMTYSRHFAMLENVHLALGRDLPRTVAFFRQIDKMKPSRQAVMAQHGISDEKDVRLVRAYEGAVAQMVARNLLELSDRAASARIK
jgi:hypothetical protein